MSAHFVNDAEAGIARNAQQYLPSSKEFSTTRARLALAGHTLEARQSDGLVRWTVGRWGTSYRTAEWTDILAFLRRIGG